MTVMATGTICEPVALVKLTGTSVSGKMPERLVAENTPVDVLKLMPTADNAVLLAVGMLMLVTAPAVLAAGVAEILLAPLV